MITLTFFQPIVSCASKGVYVGEMYKKRGMENSRKEEVLKTRSSLRNFHGCQAKGFVLDFRMANKRNPSPDIRWWAYGNGGEAKPVWMIDCMRRWPAQAVQHSRTRRLRPREIGESEAPVAAIGGTRGKSEKTKVALTVGHTIDSASG